MALPVLPLALGGAALLYLLTKPSKAQPMPDDVKAAYEDLLANGKDPDAMEKVASEFDSYGWPEEAGKLRAKAAQLRAEPRPSAAPVAPSKPPAIVPVTPDGPAIPVTPPPAPSPPTSAPQYATVTTNDPPPAGDLIIRDQPDPSASQIGGAEKGGTVTVLDWNPDAAGVFAKVAWGGGSRWPACTGFVKKQYLTMTAAPPVPAPSSTGPTARVTTNDPAPSGDLIIRDQPSPSGQQIGGAEKDGLVTVLDWNPDAAGIYAEVAWPGGSRLPAATGYVKKQYLTLTPTTSGTVIGAAGLRYARCAAPSGCRLRDRPSTLGKAQAIVPSGSTVRLLALLPGTKAESISPGPGGWAHVQYANRNGFVPAEWLVMQ